MLQIAATLLTRHYLRYELTALIHFPIYVPTTAISSMSAPRGNYIVRNQTRYNT